MTKLPANDLFSLSMKCFTLGMEAQSVIWLRTMRIASGGALGRREMHRMVEEKVLANWFLALELMSDTSGTPESIATKSVDYYTKHVRANRKRLSRAA